jgi:hypothetical protein
MGSSSIAWKVFAAVAAVAANTAAKKVTTVTWRAATGGPPPANKHDPAYSAAQIAVFTIISSGLAGGFKAYAHHKAADFYIRSSGEVPEPVAKQVKKAKKAMAEEEAAEAEAKNASKKQLVQKAATGKKGKPAKAKKKAKAKARPATA